MDDAMRLAALALCLAGCLTMGVSQQRDAAVQALDADQVCFVEDSSDGPAWYDPYDTCVHHDPKQAVIIARQFGWGAVLGMHGHELGHAIEHREGGDYRNEQMADEWAGCALARAGESLRSTRAFLEARNPGPPTYETTAGRMRDVAAGYNRCLDEARR